MLRNLPLLVLLRLQHCTFSFLIISIHIYVWKSNPIMALHSVDWFFYLLCCKITDKGIYFSWMMYNFVGWVLCTLLILMWILHIFSHCVLIIMIFMLFYFAFLFGDRSWVFWNLLLSFYSVDNNLLKTMGLF